MPKHDYGSDVYSESQSDSSSSEDERSNRKRRKVNPYAAVPAFVMEDLEKIVKKNRKQRRRSEMMNGNIKVSKYAKFVQWCWKNDPIVQQLNESKPTGYFQRIQDHIVKSWKKEKENTDMLRKIDSDFKFKDQQKGKRTSKKRKREEKDDSNEEKKKAKKHGKPQKRKEEKEKKKKKKQRKEESDEEMDIENLPLPTIEKKEKNAVSSESKSQGEELKKKSEKWISTYKNYAQKRDNFEGIMIKNPDKPMEKIEEIWERFSTGSFLPSTNQGDKLAVSYGFDPNKYKSAEDFARASNSLLTSINERFQSEDAKLKKEYSTLYKEEQRLVGVNASYDPILEKFFDEVFPA